MFELIHKLYTILNQLKGFEAGYSTDNFETMIVNYKGKNYKITIKELGEGNIENYIR